MSRAERMLKMAPIKMDTYHLRWNVWTNKFDRSSPEMCPALQ